MRPAFQDTLFSYDDDSSTTIHHHDDKQQLHVFQLFMSWDSSSTFFSEIMLLTWTMTVHSKEILLTIGNNKKIINKKKMHFLSVLAIFKDEGSSLKLWLEHYRWMGVDHFYLIDNGSTDNSRKVLEPYEKKGIVSVFFLPEKHKQTGHYRHVYDKAIKNQSVWVLIADLDEFWYVKGSTIKKELEAYPQYPVIFSKWRMFGSDGLLTQPDDIRVSITHRVESLNPNTKCIFQTKHIQSPQVCVHTIEEEPNQMDGSGIFRLNHYPIQSWEYFQKVKMNRGDVSSSSDDNIRDKKYFQRYDKDTTFEDMDLKQMVLQQQQHKRNHFILQVIKMFCLILFVLCVVWLLRLKTNKKNKKKRS